MGKLVPLIRAPPRLDARMPRSCVTTTMRAHWTPASTQRVASSAKSLATTITPARMTPAHPPPAATMLISLRRAKMERSAQSTPATLKSDAQVQKWTATLATDASPVRALTAQVA